MENLNTILGRVRAAARNLRNGKFALSNLEVIVIGPQSAGKSSVVETLIGKPCLPRGSPIVCPVRIQLHRLESLVQQGGHLVEDYAEVPLLPSGQVHKIITDLRLLPGFLMMEMQRLNPKPREGLVVEQEVHVHIYSTKTADLTFVHLPGLRMLEDERTVLVRKYLRNPKTLILAVTSALDLEEPCTSLAIDEARKVDPEMNRTIVVVTKLDLLRRDCQLLSNIATNVLEGNLSRTARLGVVGVANLSIVADDLLKRIKQQQLEEAKILEENFGPLGTNHGSRVLLSRLQKGLILAVKDEVRNLKNLLGAERCPLQIRLNQLEPVPGGETELAATLLPKYCGLYQYFILIERRLPLNMGALRFLLSTEIPEIQLEATEIDCMIDFYSRFGSVALLFESVIKNILRPRISNLLNSANKCIDVVKASLLTLVQEIREIHGNELIRSPHLADKIRTVIEALISDQQQVAVSDISRYITVSSNCILLGDVNLLVSEADRLQVCDGEDAQDLKLLSARRYVIRNESIRMYREAAEKFKDYCLQVIYTSMFREVNDKILERLYSKLLGDRVKVAALLKEEMKTRGERQELKNRIAALEKAKSWVDDFLR